MPWYLKLYKFFDNLRNSLDSLSMAGVLMDPIHKMFIMNFVIFLMIRNPAVKTIIRNLVDALWMSNLPCSITTLTCVILHDRVDIHKTSNELLIIIVTLGCFIMKQIRMFMFEMLQLLNFHHKIIVRILDLSKNSFNFVEICAFQVLHSRVGSWPHPQTLD